jgi:hypothetical protein
MKTATERWIDFLGNAIARSWLRAQLEKSTPGAEQMECRPEHQRRATKLRHSISSSNDPSRERSVP